MCESELLCNLATMVDAVYIGNKWYYYAKIMLKIKVLSYQYMVYYSVVTGKPTTKITVTVASYVASYFRIILS